MFGFKKGAMPKAGEALPGRASPIRTAATHFINQHALKGPYPEGFEKHHVAGVSWFEAAA
jgi:peptide-methionine (S)-S-oxide reductase